MQPRRAALTIHTRLKKRFRGTSMSKKRWMTAVLAEVKKSESEVQQALPFTRQARAAKRKGTLRLVVKKSGA